MKKSNWHFLEETKCWTIMSEFNVFIFFISIILFFCFIFFLHEQKTRAKRIDLGCRWDVKCVDIISDRVLLLLL